MSKDTEGLLEWTEEQCRFCATAMLRAVSATTLVKVRPTLGQTIRPGRGSILASPEMAAYDPYPDYFFHWLRDLALVADALREAIEAGMLELAAIEHLADFVAFSLGLCRLDGPSFLKGGGFPEAIEPSFLQHVRPRDEIADVTGDRVLGEPRFNADGSLDVMKWARPQNDGPALRALTVTRFFALDGFRERAGAAAMNLLRYDLDYTLSHWRQPCFDLWEETSGFHYHTRLIQYAALAAGAAFMATEGDAGRATTYAGAARELFVELDAHFAPEDGVYRGRLTEVEDAPGAPPPRRLDISVVLAVVQTGPRAGSHSVVDPKILATMTALEASCSSSNISSTARVPRIARRRWDATLMTLISAAAPIISRRSARLNFTLCSRGPPRRERRSPSRGKAGLLSPPFWERPRNCSRRARSRPSFASDSPKRRFVAATCSFPWRAVIRPRRENCRSSSTRTTARRIRLEIFLGVTPVSSPHMRRAGAPVAQWARDPRQQDEVRRQKFAPNSTARRSESTTGSRLPRFCPARPRSESRPRRGGMDFQAARREDHGRSASR